ncbi:hypothetical protein RND71_003285 [Anisodus tanguticus]|uniref:Uncharacterized protein n=1 Tax=Anisodus tanguticus TaxID=243964 RepID=A0AAE1VWK3_9SOLA|nr:hypothetical protein RND71_003285 [Anisodus tanguticus]
MEVFRSEGLSWADQWDPESPPPPNEDDKKKHKNASKNKFLKWFKNIGKKSNNSNKK